MRPHEVENWAWSIVDKVEAGQPVEDSRVELKSSWIESQKAARRIAGHANAARGAPILWLIGVDEQKGVVGVDHANLANWYGSVKAHFDGLAPQMEDYNVPVRDTTIVALLFETNRAPFVVRNPVHGCRGGGAVSLEVPWREGTSVRSATRADLLRLLSPLQALPNFEVLDGSLHAGQGEGEGEPCLAWLLKLSLYAETDSRDLVVIPFHRCKGHFEVLGSIQRTEFYRVSLRPPMSPPHPGIRSENLSRTLESTRDETLIAGPGRLEVFGRALTAQTDATFEADARVTVNLMPVTADRPIPIAATLHRCSPGPRDLYAWALTSRTQSPDGGSLW